MRKVLFLCLVRNMFLFFTFVCQTSGIHLPSHLRLLAFLVCLESFDWVQQDIFEVILLNRCSMEEGKSERGNFKQPKQCFESSHVLRIMTDW